MPDMPAPTAYHRWLGWHAPDLHRTLIVGIVGAAALLVVGPFTGWRLAVVVGWDCMAVAFLLSTWPIIIRADGAQTRQIAVREDDTRGTARALLLGASVASLVGAGFTLSRAGHATGARQIVLIGLAVLTVLLSWTLVNTVYTLRYAHVEYDRPGSGVDFEGTSDADPPTYRDFAYVAFTIGMTYQVSDTAMRDSVTRRTALSHALLSYLFGVVIVAGVINLIGGLVR